MMILLAALFVLSPVVLYLTREKPISVMIAADVVAYVALLLMVCELAGMMVHRNWKASLPRT